MVMLNNATIIIFLVMIALCANAIEFTQIDQYKEHNSPVQRIEIGNGILSLDANNETVARFPNRNTARYVSNRGGDMIFILPTYYVTQYSASRIILWDRETGAYLSSLKCEEKLQSLNISLDGRVLAGICSGGAIRVWTPRSKGPVAQRYSEDGPFVSLVLTEDNLIVAATEHSVEWFDRDYNLIEKKGYPRMFIRKLRYNQHKKILYALTDSDVWRWNKGREMMGAGSSMANIFDIISSPSHKMHLEYFGAGCRIIDREQNTISGILRAGHFQWSPIESFIYNVESGLLILRSGATGTPLKEVSYASDPITSAAFSDKEDRMATGHKSGTIRIWQVKLPTAKVVLEGPRAKDDEITVKNDLTHERLIQRITEFLKENPKAKISISRL